MGSLSHIIQPINTLLLSHPLPMLLNHQIISLNSHNILHNILINNILNNTLNSIHSSHINSNHISNSILDHSPTKLPQSRLNMRICFHSCSKRIWSRPRRLLRYQQDCQHGIDLTFSVTSIKGHLAMILNIVMQ